jgi:hypothetical protein
MAGAQSAIVQGAIANRIAPYEARERLGSAG